MSAVSIIPLGSPLLTGGFSSLAWHKVIQERLFSADSVSMVTYLNPEIDPLWKKLQWRHDSSGFSLKGARVIQMFNQNGFHYLARMNFLPDEGTIYLALFKGECVRCTIEVDDELTFAVLSGVGAILLEQCGFKRAGPKELEDWHYRFDELTEGCSWSLWTLDPIEVPSLQRYHPLRRKVWRRG